MIHKASHFLMKNTLGGAKTTKTVKKKHNLRYLHYQDTPMVNMGVKISGKANMIQAKRFGAQLFTLH